MTIEVWLKPASLKPFAITFEPAGSVLCYIPELIIGTLLTLLSNTVLAAVAAFVRNGFSIKLYDLPQKDLTICGTKLTVKSMDLGIKAVKGLIGAVGDITVE